MDSVRLFDVMNTGTRTYETSKHGSTIVQPLTLEGVAVTDVDSGSIATGVAGPEEPPSGAEVSHEPVHQVS
jgi:hypothetical protein